MGLFSSKSSSSSTTTNTDARVVGGDESSNVSVNNNAGPVSLTTTDHGAIAGSLTLALKGVEGAQQIAREAQAASGGLLEGALRMSGEQQQQFTSAIENIKTSDVRTLIVVGMGVVGVVAVVLLRRRA